MLDDERERACAPPLVPAAIAADVAGYRWTRDRVGQSGGRVYRLHGRPGAPDVFLKHGTRAVAGDVADAAERLRWLAGRLPVPAVAGFVRTRQAAWLLTTAIPGRTAEQLLGTNPAAREAVVDALVAFLRRLHAIPLADCPFDSGHAVRMARARSRIDAGLVEVDEFDDARQGWTAEQVWDAMHTLLPLDPDPVVTHGDFSLDNLLVADGELIGCIDVGRVGMADRYQDLAILWDSLGEFDPALQNRMFRQYGIAVPDRRKLEFHLMLDELF